MPVSPTYPGVYIEEIPSGVHTIVGVATSITAFIGRTVSGPTQQPVVINGFGDFDQQFGGLDVDCPLSYAVNDFYQNGGNQAIIVRVTGSAATSATLSGNSLTLVASSPGTWGNALVASVDNLNITDPVAARYGLTAADLFNLTVSEVVGTRTISQERFLHLSFKADGPTVSAAARAQRVDRVLSQSSQLVRLALQKDGITPNLPTTSPLGKPAAAAKGGAAGAGTGAAGAAPDDGGAAPVAGAAPAAAGPPAPIALKNNGDGVDSGSLKPADLIGLPDNKTGIYALETADLFNLLCIPTDTPGGDTDISVYQAALAYCVTRRAVLIVDSPSAWSANPVTAAANAVAGVGALGLTGDAARNAALYFPRVIESDPLSNGQLITVPPCGIMAGIMAQTDVSRGVWKAPAGVEATLSGINALQVNLTNAENGSLNPLAINCLRTFPVYGSVVWGARTMAGADQLADDYKYIPVRRLALFLEESLYRGTQWVVFEPNDTPLWASIRLNVGSFMHNLFVQGAFQGQTPADAYFVSCDSTTNPQNQIDLGIVNIVVGFAPLKPAEFVILQIQQIAGNILT
jgi:phage tail sheath protein FI